MVLMAGRDKPLLASSFTLLLVLLLALSITRTSTHHDEPVDGDNEGRMVEGEYLDQRSCRDGRVLVPLADVSITEAYKSDIRRNEAKYRKEEKLMSKNCQSKICSYDVSKTQFNSMSDFGAGFLVLIAERSV